MLINLSSDKVEIFQNNNITILEKNNLERNFPQTLKKLNLQKNNKIYIINWPWSFTTLRVWTLTINIINRLFKKKLNIYNTSKIELYKFLVWKNILPTKWIIYIWQRKKARLYDFTKNTYDYILYSEIKNLNSNYFIDKIYNINHNLKIDFYLENNNLVIKFLSNIHKISFKNLPFVKTNLIKPNYILRPNICLKNN